MQLIETSFVAIDCVPFSCSQFEPLIRYFYFEAISSLLAALNFENFAED